MGVLDGVYAGTYAGFEYNGEYRLVFYARNTDGLVSMSPATVVTVSGGKEIVKVVGDVNDDEKVDLRDVILVLQVMADVKTGVVMNRQGDVNGDGLMDMRDAIYIIQKVGGLR
jgi:hypothetical protein